MAYPRPALRFGLLLLSVSFSADVRAASADCARYIPAAENYYALPPGLLSAVNDAARQRLMAARRNSLLIVVRSDP